MASTPKSTNGEDVDTEKLNKGSAESYDEISGYWEDILGEHMHHGFYDSSTSFTNSLSDLRLAQIRMIEAALRFASISEDPLKKPKSILDVGCGIGGTTLYLAKKYDTQCKGITLGPEEVQRARYLTAAQGLENKVSFEVGDALNQPFPDGQFDLIWCMESTEQMPDKRKLLSELARVAAPGATIIITSSCHRDLSPFEESLDQDEKKLLKKISDTSFSPNWCSTADFVDIMKSLSLQEIKSADWSRYVAPTRPAMTRVILSWKGITSTVRRGWKTVKAALSYRFIVEGYKKGLLKFSIITCKKGE